MASPKEVAKLAGVDMVMDFEEEPLIEFKCTGKLLHELPDTFSELSEDRGHFLCITIEMATPGKLERKLRGCIL